MKQHVDAIACRVMQVVPGHTKLLVGWSRAEHLSASGKGLQGAEPQGCAENKAISQRDQKYCRSSYRMSYGRGCSAANKLVGSEQISPIQGTADPQVPSVIKHQFLTAPRAFRCTSSRRRTSVWSTPGTDASTATKQRCHVGSCCKHWQLWKAWPLTLFKLLSQSSHGSISHPWWDMAAVADSQVQVWG